MAPRRTSAVGDETDTIGDFKKARHARRWKQPRTPSLAKHPGAGPRRSASRLHGPAQRIRSEKVTNSAEKPSQRHGRFSGVNPHSLGRMHLDRNCYSPRGFKFIENSFNDTSLRSTVPIRAIGWPDCLGPWSWEAPSGDHAAGGHNRSTSDRDFRKHDGTRTDHRILFDDDEWDSRM